VVVREVIDGLQTRSAFLALSCPFPGEQRLALLIRSCPSTLSTQDTMWRRVKRQTSCRMEHTLAELMVLCHQPLEVRTAELSAGSGRAIPHLGFKCGVPPPATHRQLHALDPGALFA
jgi:hypothetical protein